MLDTNDLRFPIPLGSLARSGATSVLALSLGACTGETVDLGEVARDLATGRSRCAESTLVEGSVLIEDQEQLAQLEGCEEIAGDLRVRPFAGADFRPLSALRVVGGALELGRVSVLDTFELPPDVQARIGEIYEQELALLGSGCFSSLAGFEALERVGRLSLNGLGTPDLLPFSNLSALTDGGALSIGVCANLRALTGLERLRGVVELTSLCNSLESLAGPRFAPRMGDVYLSGESLVDLGAFAPESVNQLRIEGTALENLDALSRLARATSVEITGNTALVELDALTTLNDVGDLRITLNPLLERLPELTAMVQLDALTIQLNDSLTNFPSLPNLGFISSGTEWGDRGPDEAIMLRPDIIEISGNPAIESIAIPPGWLAASYVSITGNERLTSIDLANIHAADGLYIGANPALRSVALGLLETVDDLRVIDNPLLPLETFDAVQTFRRTVQAGPLDFDQL